MTALTQIRDIAFVKTEPQNKYNLWLHFKEEERLVLELWSKGRWYELNNSCNINILNFSLGEYAIFKVPNIETIFSCKVECTNPAFVSDISIIGENRYNITNLHFTRHLNFATIEFDMDYYGHCVYTFDGGFAKGYIIRHNGNFPIEIMEYNLEYIDLITDGNYQDDKVNIAILHYHDDINGSIQTISFITKIVQNNKEYYHSVFSTSVHDYNIVCIIEKEDGIIYSRAYAEDSVDSKIEKQTNSSLVWKGKRTNASDAVYPGVFGITQPFRMQDNFNLGERDYPAGSFIIVHRSIGYESFRYAYIQSSFSDNVGNYNIKIEINSDITSLDYNNINNQLNLNWQLETNIEGASKFTETISDVSLTEDDYIDITVTIQYNENVEEYSGANLVSFHIKIKNHTTLIPNNYYPEGVIFIDYVYKEQCGFTYPSNKFIEYHPERIVDVLDKYVIPGLQETSINNENNNDNEN